MPPELMQNHPYGRLPYGQQAMNMYTQNQPLPPGELFSFSHHHLIIVMVVSKMLSHWFRLPTRTFLNFIFIIILQRRSRFGASIQTCSQPTDEQNDARSTKLHGHDVRHAGQHARHDGAGQAIFNGFQTAAQHATGTNTATAAPGAIGKSVWIQEPSLSIM